MIHHCESFRQCTATTVLTRTLCDHDQVSEAVEAAGGVLPSEALICPAGHTGQCPYS